MQAKFGKLAAHAWLLRILDAGYTGSSITGYLKFSALATNYLRMAEKGEVANTDCSLNDKEDVELSNDEIGKAGMI